jgi:hypothetical protein
MEFCLSTSILNKLAEELYPEILHISFFISLFLRKRGFLHYFNSKSFVYSGRETSDQSQNMSNTGLEPGTSELRTLWTKEGKR